MTLILLVIVTLMVIFASSVGFFEQKTATDENRARIASQAAEYALNLAGEYLKANRSLLISDTGTGWFSTANPHWARCGDIGYTDASFTPGHPCLSGARYNGDRDLPARSTCGSVLLDVRWLDRWDAGLAYTSIIPAAAQR